METKSKVIQELKEWTKAFVIVGTFAYILFSVIIINASVPSASMYPTIATDDRIIASRLAFLFNQPERFDIVIFENPTNHQGEYFIKRVIGLPGDLVEIRSGVVYIDGVPLEGDADFIKEPFWGNWGPQVVEPDTLFVLGDHRNNSLDSRSFGFIDQDTLVGRGVFKYFRNLQILR